MISEGIDFLTPAAVFAISVAVFGIVIFNLHRTMSLRNVLGIDLSGLRRSGRPWRLLIYCVGYVFLYGAVFPTLVYVWFWLMVALLATFYNSREPTDLMLIAMAVLTAVRVTAYYSEDLARDIAKILPYGLVGIFVINLGHFDLYATLDLLEGAVAEEDAAFYYWVYMSGQELFLRVSQPIVCTSYNYIRAAVVRRTEAIARRFRDAPAEER